MATWSFAAFDWVRFRALAPELKRAHSVGDLRASANEQIAEVASPFNADEPVSTVCNVIIVELCTRGKWVVVRPSLPELVRRLCTRPAGEDAAEILTDLALSGQNIEPWFKSDAGLMGLLTITDVEHLAAHLEAYARERPKSPPPEGVLGWARKLTPVGDDEDLMEALTALVIEASLERLGLAAVLDP
jgi:hypothetical protein